MTDNFSLLAENARRILTAAALSRYGIQIHCTAPDLNMIAPSSRAKQVLYRFKRENHDFDNLKIDFHPTDPDNRLWIINTKELDKAPAELMEPSDG